MLYNRLTDNELERAVYIDPQNQAARAELLRRTPGYRDNQLAELEEAKDTIESMEADHRVEVENLQDDLRDAETHIKEITTDLDAANERIHALTACADLV